MSPYYALHITSVHGSHEKQPWGLQVSLHVTEMADGPTAQLCECGDMKDVKVGSYYLSIFFWESVIAMPTLMCARVSI